MGINILVILLCSGILTLMVLLIAAKPKLAIRISGIFSVVAAVGGVLIYGYGFAATVENLILACVQTLISVCGMFVAAFDFSTISDAPLFQHTWAQIAYWVIHLMAFYATVSAALSTFGSGLLASIRVRFARWEGLHLIFGINDNSIDYGRELLARGETALVFIGEGAEENQLAAISELGALVRLDDQALEGSEPFLKSLGAGKGKRSLALYALGEDKTANLCYARKLLESMEKRGIAPERTSLVIHGREDSAAAQLQVLSEKYGYGFVTVYQEADLAARLLVKKYPPCSVMDFDELGAARQDFSALVVGFGAMGQAVLKNLVMNGQFVGSNFRACVVSPDCETVNGAFSSISEHLRSDYDIHFLGIDARSSRMYEYLQENAEQLRYIVICAGADKTNREIAEELILFLERRGQEIPVFQCAYQGIRAYDPAGKVWVHHKLYHPDILNAREMDGMAMVINHYYQGSSGVTPVADWMNCDFFSRMSCRASADFMDAMLKAAGKTEDQVLAGDWVLSEKLLENLSIMEHLRWCAFHFCMGFSPMTAQEYDSRTARYLAEKAETGNSRIRIGKNMQDRTHACLIPWEALDKLSETESAITGKSVNYKAMDTDNVLAVPRMLEIRSKL